MKPSEKVFKTVSFPDADFSEVYGHGAMAMDVPVYFESKTGFVIMVANCPIM